MSRRARSATAPQVRAPTPEVCDFGGLEIEHDAGVITLRPWTILQSEWAVELCASLPSGPVLELCCGVGHIGLVVARRTGRRLVQVDSSEAACAFARRNAARAGLSGDVEVRCADLDEAVTAGERFPLVVADPPYVPSDEVDRFPDDPRSAIDGGPDGLGPARRCLSVADGVLTDRGALLLQLRDRGQAEAVADTGPFELVEVRTAGADRAVALLRQEPVRTSRSSSGR